MSVKRKIIFWFASIVCLVSISAFLIIISVSRTMLLSASKKSLEEAVESCTDETDYYYILDEESTSPSYQYIPYSGGYLEIDGQLFNNNKNIVLGIYNEQNILIYGVNPIGEELMKIPFSNSSIASHKISGEKYFIFDKKLDDTGNSSLWIRGVLSVKTSLSDLYDIFLISFIIICIIIHISIVVIILITDKIFAPVKKITDMAVKINSGSDLKERINMGDRKDEFGILAYHFDKMVDRLDTAFENEKQFTSNVSHELRTPVSVISAQCEYILESPREADEYIEALEVIARQNKRMSSLISDMLSITRLENKKYNYAFSEFDFSQAVKNVCTDMSLLENNGIKFSYDIQDNITINGEKDLLEQLLLNLIGNAYKYGKENGNIIVTLKKEKGKIYLSVTDDGIGIAKEDLSKIFERFYRCDSSRSVKGTGLGLSIALGIAKLHGGNIVVESTLGQGSTFTLII